jgi:hypothetical protein
MNITTNNRLQKLYKSLSEQDQGSLIAFAEFLQSRSETALNLPEKILNSSPNPTPRPEKESVIGAIKRLSAGYPMIDKSTLLDETSNLVNQHIIKGRKANEVIDDIEALFERSYQTLLSKQTEK